MNNQTQPVMPEEEQAVDVACCDHDLCSTTEPAPLDLGRAKTEKITISHKFALLPLIITSGFEQDKLYICVLLYKNTNN